MRGRSCKSKGLKYPPVPLEAPDQIIVPCYPQAKIPLVACKEVPLKKMVFTKRADSDSWITLDTQLNQGPPAPKPRTNKRNNVVKVPRHGPGARDISKIQPEIRRRPRHFDGVKKKSNLDNIRAKDMTAGDSSCEEISPNKLFDSEGKPLNRKRKKKTKVRTKEDPDVLNIPILPATEKTEELPQTSEASQSQGNQAGHLNLVEVPNFANLSTPDLFPSAEEIDTGAVPEVSQVIDKAVSQQQNLPPDAEKMAIMPAERIQNGEADIPGKTQMIDEEGRQPIQRTTARLEIRITMSTPMNQPKKSLIVTLADDSPTYSATDRVPNISNEIKAMRLEPSKLVI